MQEIFIIGYSAIVYLINIESQCLWKPVYVNVYVQ